MFSRIFPYLRLAAARALLGLSAFRPRRPCTGPGAPTTTETKCLTCGTDPGAALQSYDISWVTRIAQRLPRRSLDAAIDIIDTLHVTFRGSSARGSSWAFKLKHPGLANES